MDDCNREKSTKVSIITLKHLEKLMSIYGPLNEFGKPEKVTSISLGYYSKELKIRMQAIENICDYIRNHSEKCDEEALRNERTKVLQEISSIIEEAKEQAHKTKKPLSLSESQEDAVMAYAIKRQEEVYYEEAYYTNPDEEESLSNEEEYFSAEELFIAYGEESTRSLSKRLGTTINVVK